MAPELYGDEVYSVRGLDVWAAGVLGVFLMLGNNLHDHDTILRCWTFSADSVSKAISEVVEEKLNVYSPDAQRFFRACFSRHNNRPNVFQLLQSRWLNQDGEGNSYLAIDVYEDFYEPPASIAPSEAMRIVQTYFELFDDYKI